MRRVFGSMAVAGAMAVLASPAFADRTKDTDVVSAPVAVQRVAPAVGIRDEAAMVLVGTALIGLAAAVRRNA